MIIKRSSPKTKSCGHFSLDRPIISSLSFIQLNSSFIVSHFIRQHTWRWKQEHSQFQPWWRHSLAPKLKKSTSSISGVNLSWYWFQKYPKQEIILNIQNIQHIQISPTEGPRWSDVTNEVLPNIRPSPRRDLTLWRPEVTIRNEERKWKRAVLHPTILRYTVCFYVIIWWAGKLESGRKN